VSLPTIAVQLGFAAGALGLAVIGAPDVIAARRLFLSGALVAGASEAAFAAAADSLALAIPLRFLTGAALAAVYPIASSSSSAGSARAVDSPSGSSSVVSRWALRWPTCSRPWGCSPGRTGG
jgi:hypothetical protein